jgi:hypothetical protein
MYNASPSPSDVGAICGKSQSGHRLILKVNKTTAAIRRLCGFFHFKPITTMVVPDFSAPESMMGRNKQWGLLIKTT